MALITICATAAMHWAGVEYSFYWIYYAWWDIPTHILGGLTVGLWTAAVVSRMGLPTRRAAFLIIGFALTVGLAWELWEVLEGVGGGWGGYWFDTIKDLCDDTIGGSLAWLLYKTLM